MERLSVILITFNEEDNITACLESVKWTDEIVIVDSFSSDKTPDMCKAYTDKFLQKEWEGYAKQKNFALSQSTGQWILWVDADEVVTEDLKYEIQNAVQKDAFDGFFIPRRNFFLGKWLRHGGWYPDYTLRLFKKEKAIFEEKRVHEKVILDGAASHLKNDLLHYTYKSLDDYIKRQNTYSSLAAQELCRRVGQRKTSLSYQLFKFFWKFFETYIYKKGFLDGYYGLVVSLSASYFTFIKHSKAREFKNDKTKGSSV